MVIKAISLTIRITLSLEEGVTKKCNKIFENLEVVIMKGSAFPRCVLFFTLISLYFSVQMTNAIGFGCTDDASCTDLCGYAGAGTCVNSTYCQCATCPQRSTAEISLAYALKVCTLDPICQLNCPMPTFSFTTGKMYFGHTCTTPTKLTPTCICFCMPTTAASLLDVIKCPIPPKTTNTTSSSIPSTIKVPS